MLANRRWTLSGNDLNQRLTRLSTPQPRNFLALAIWCSRFTAPLLLHGYMLRLLGEPKIKANDKIIIGVMFSVFTFILGSYLYVVARNNDQERKDLKKLQAMLEKPEIIVLIQAALERNLTFSQSEALQPDIILSESDRADAEWMLSYMEAWARSSNQLAEILPTLFTGVSGQIIPQPYQEAMGRLMFEAGISPLKQIEAKLDYYNINRTFGKGGLYRLSTHIHSENVNLKELLNLVRADNPMLLDTLLLHNHTNYKAVLLQLSDSPDPVRYAEFKTAFLAVVKTILIHDAVQTTFKLGLGAFGWQCAYRVFLGNAPYISSFSSMTWQKPLLWMSTGVGAAIALNMGILTSQSWLSYQHQGVDVKRFKTLSLQLMFSVTVADSLWQPCADLGTLYVSFWKAIQPETGYIMEPIVFFIIYLSLSFFFKEVHNWTNLVHKENSEQKKFICTNEFIGILAATYWSFKVIFGCIASTVNLAEYNAMNVFFDCLLAGVCSAFLPMLLLIGQSSRKMQALSDSLEKHVAQRLSDDSRMVNFASAETLERPLISSSQNSPFAAQANSSTLFCLKPLAQISKVYDKVVEGAASYFP